MQFIELDDDAAEQQLGNDQYRDHDVDDLGAIEARTDVEAQHVGETGGAE